MAQINPADLNAIGELYVPVEHICDGYQEQWDNCPGQAEQDRFVLAEDGRAFHLQSCFPLLRRPRALRAL